VVIVFAGAAAAPRAYAAGAAGPFTWTDKASQVLIKLKASNTSATGHWPLAAHAITSPLMRRGGRGCPGRRVLADQRVSLSA
jgi:hypothetical protein